MHRYKIPSDCYRCILMVCWAAYESHNKCAGNSEKIRDEPRQSRDGNGRRDGEECMDNGAARP